MGSFTLHALDDELDYQLSIEAKRQKKSKNQLVKEILARHLGMPDKNGSYEDDYSEFCGLWSAAEAADFNRIQKENNRIDDGEWT